MKPSLDIALHLLHSTPSGALATHSTQLPGYPFVSALPFVTDERHCPVFLLSGLAEHTKNLGADQRASFLVTAAAATDVLSGSRMTLVGDVVRIDAEQELVERYIRYQPEARQYLGLGDFAFFRLTPRRVRHIAGFAQMGWIEDADWAGAAVLPLADETQCLLQLAGTAQPGVRLLGVDCYGCDIEHDNKRDRLRFAGAIHEPEKITESAKRILAAP